MAVIELGPIRHLHCAFNYGDDDPGGGLGGVPAHIHVGGGCGCGCGGGPTAAEAAAEAIATGILSKGDGGAEVR